MTVKLDLAAGFPPAGLSAWAGLVARAVGDPAGPEALRTPTRDGISIAPLYPQRHPGRHVAARAGRWTIFQRVDHPDPAAANELALADLAGGADGLEIVFPGSAAAHGFGVGIETLDDLDRLLEGIDLERVPLRLDGGYEVRQAIAMVTALIERRGLDASKVDIAAESDPANGMFSDGRLVVSYDLAGDRGADMVRGLMARGLNLPVFVGEGRAVHAAGGTEVQELAFALAAGVEHMRALESRGIALEDAARMVTFSLAADADQFLSIAKLRAFRLAWARVVEVAGLPDRPARVHVETAWRMMARRDPWVNMLRTAVAVAAAGLGGADSVLALPFTLANGLPDAFARRVARNCQLVLIEEAGLADVADPAAGSGYVEALTGEFAEAAWDRFRAIERHGGIIETLRSGTFQADVMSARSRREADAAKRVEPIIGVSVYPWLAEVPAATLKVDARGLQPSGDRIRLPAGGRGERFDALVTALRDGVSMADLLATIGHEWERTDKAPWWRVAEPFERLRDASDAALADTARRPTAFLAVAGTPRDVSARAGWARNVYEAGGIALLDGCDAGSADEIARAFVHSGAKAACISPAKGHEREAIEMARWLKAAGARHICHVGAPGDGEHGLRDAGVDDFIQDGCDILAVLQTIHVRLGLGNGAQPAAR